MILHAFDDMKHMIWWYEVLDMYSLWVPTNTSTTAYPYKGNHKDPPLQVFGYYMMYRGYPVDTRYHDIACIWWHENTWFDVLRLHDYGDIQYITRSLRHHGDHYICYKEYTCSAWYLYHRVGDMPTIPMETTSSRYMVCAQRMVPWYEDPKWVEIHVLGVPKHVLRVGIGTGLAHLGHYGTWGDHLHRECPSVHPGLPRGLHAVPHIL